jgi:ERF superfamily
MSDTQIIERPAPAHDFGELMMGLLRDPSIPADKLEVVMKMRREALEYEAKEAYMHHFALFTADMPAVERDGMVDLGAKGKYPFTTYEQMDLILRPLLVKHGFSLQYWSSDAEKIDVIVVHGALAGWGWQRESVYPVPPDSGPGRNALQARGSSQTYAKRYIADLLCNIVRKGADNDGRGAVDAFIDAKQAKELTDLMKATDTKVGAFLNTMLTDVKEVADIRVRDYSRLFLALKERQKRQVRKELSK